MKPHKHAELIKAWADGHEIEYFDVKTDKWWGQDNPDWYEFYEYRIKPEPKPDVVGYSYLTLKQAETSQSFYLFGDRSVNSNFKVTFDGKTGELKSAEVLK